MSELNVGRVEMKIDIMLLAILPMLIISGVDGFSLGIDNGKESYSTHIDANKGVDVSGHFSLNGEDLDGNCEFKGNGPLHATETRSDSKGDSVTLAAKGFLFSGDYYKPTWDVKHNYITGIQGLKATGSNFELTSKAVNRNGLEASVSAGVGKGSIDINQVATASEVTADSRQKIASASGDDIELIAETSDGSGKNKADSSVTIYHDGILKNYNSEAEGTYLDKKKHDVDLYAMHGPIIVGADTTNPAGSISGDTIVSKGSTSNQKGLSADYDVKINHGSVEGIFDWGTETKSNSGVIAVPLESPAAWGGPSGTISINGQCPNKAASKIESNSEAYIVESNGNIIMISQDNAKATRVKVDDWKKGNGFAKSSQAGNI